jgi:hypothetical protein
LHTFLGEGFVVGKVPGDVVAVEACCRDVYEGDLTGPAPSMVLKRIERQKPDAGENAAGNNQGRFLSVSF